MLYDPHSGVQLRALCSDPTGSYSPPVDRKPEPWWLGYVIGIAAACVFALLLWWPL